MASVAKRTWTYNGQEKTAWGVRYFDENGVHRSKQFDLKKEADAFRRKVEREIEDGVHVPRSKAATVKACVAEFLEANEAREADGRIGINRLVSLRHTMGKRVIPHLGELRLVDLTAQRVDQFYRDLQKKDRLSLRTAKDTVYDLRLLEVFATKRGYMKTAPVSDALVDLRGTKKTKVRTFTSEQVGHLLSVVATRGHNFKARSAAMIECMVNIAVFCGLRYGEIMALDLGCIDLERGMIKVRHSLLFNDERKGPKTSAGNRDVPMPGRVRDLLGGWVEHWYVENARDLVFRTPKATIVSQANFHRQWTYLLDRAGLADDGPTFHFHALRHFCASWMIENGLPVTDVASLLGHSKFDTTLQVYAHPVVRPAMRHEAMERMCGALPAKNMAISDARVTHGPNT